MSQPGWLTHRGRFIHISGHRSAAGRAQDWESSPVKERCSTTVPQERCSTTVPQERCSATVPRNQPTNAHGNKQNAYAFKCKLSPSKAEFAVGTKEVDVVSKLQFEDVVLADAVLVCRNPNGITQQWQTGQRTVIL